MPAMGRWGLACLPRLDAACGLWRLTPGCFRPGLLLGPLPDCPGLASGVAAGLGWLGSPPRPFGLAARRPGVIGGPRRPPSRRARGRLSGGAPSAGSLRSLGLRKPLQVGVDVQQGVLDRSQWIWCFQKASRLGLSAALALRAVHELAGSVSAPFDSDLPRAASSFCCIFFTPFGVTAFLGELLADLGLV